MSTSSAAVAKAPESSPKAVAAKTPGRPQSPYDLMRSLTDDLDRTFTEFWGRRRWPFSGLVSAGTSGASWAPPIEVEERDGQLYVRTELPGLTKDDVRVEVTENLLTIEGERKAESEKKDQGYYRSERSYGFFSRSVALPDGAKADTAKATFKDGVLSITIEVPTQAASEARRVAIED
jgi:HSP20 family protein